MRALATTTEVCMDENTDATFARRDSSSICFHNPDKRDRRERWWGRREFGYALGSYTFVTYSCSIGSLGVRAESKNRS